MISNTFKFNSEIIKIVLLMQKSFIYIYLCMFNIKASTKIKLTKIKIL